MPELPDIAGFRRLVGRNLHRIERLEVIDPAVVRNVEPAELEEAVRRKLVRRVERRRKWLVVHLGSHTSPRASQRRDSADAAIVMHFGMTGSLVLTHDALDRYDRLALIGDAELRLRDRRRLSRAWLAIDASELHRVIPAQGPDAARLTEAQLIDALRDRRGEIKAALIDQEVIAGLGNMLSDEILWRAGLHPRRSVSSLDADDIARLHEAVRDVVARSARRGRIPRTSRWLASQRAATAPSCPRCDRPLQRSVAAGRTALWCPQCQAR